MQAKIIITLLVALSSGLMLKSQDLIGLSHKQVLEYWQKTVPADQITDTGDLIRVGELTFCSFGKKGCNEFTTIIPAADVPKYKTQFDGDKQLRYDIQKDEWINDVKKYTWKISKSGDTDYQVNCKSNR